MILRKMAGLRPIPYLLNQISQVLPSDPSDVVLLSDVMHLTLGFLHVDFLQAGRKTFRKTLWQQ